MVSHRQKSRRKLREDRHPVPTSVKVIAIILILAVGYIAGTFNGQIMGAIAPVFGLKTYSGTLDLSTLQQTYQALKANYDGTVDDKALIDGANKGLVEAIGDQYTLYMNKTESQNFNNELSGTVGGGVGIEVAMRNNTLTIVRILKDNPAEKAGVMANDILVSINDESVDGMSIDTAVSKIRGDAGTTIKLTILRGSETKSFTVTRAEINNPSVYSSVSNGIGTMTITRFDDQTGLLARTAAQDFKSQNVKSVILDLRGNGGGYITAAQDVASLWLNAQLVVSEKTNGKVVDELKSGANPILGGIPTVVLVNGSSASASEIVAGALQDHKVAQLVGDKTFGKGSVQKLISLADSAQLKVTVARWYTPNGVNISKQGITPDKTITISADDITAGRDPQLDAAKALVLSLTAGVQ